MSNPTAITSKFLEEDQAMLLFVITDRVTGKQCPRGLSKKGRITLPHTAPTPVPPYVAFYFRKSSRNKCLDLLVL